MSAHDAAWYDDAMTEDGSPAMLELEHSPWLQLYTEIGRWIEPHEPVVDLGAGTGRLLKLLYDQGHYAPIEAVDWSPSALEVTLSYAIPQHENAAELTVTLADLDEWQPQPDRAGGTVYVCTEVLEHIERDQELVGQIPPGHRFIFSVPNYWSESHERWYTNPGAVWERYSDQLLFTRWVLVTIDHPIKHLHLFETRRRADAWSS